VMSLNSSDIRWLQVASSQPLDIARKTKDSEGKAAGI
jgi:hypothetical protein